MSRDPDWIESAVRDAYAKHPSVPTQTVSMLEKIIRERLQGDGPKRTDWKEIALALLRSIQQEPAAVEEEE